MPATTTTRSTARSSSARRAAMAGQLSFTMTAAPVMAPQPSLVMPAAPLATPRRARPARGPALCCPRLHMLPATHHTLIARDALLLARLRTICATADGALPAQLAARAIDQWTALALRRASRLRRSPLALTLRGMEALAEALRSWDPTAANADDSAADPCAPGRLRLPTGLSADERRLLRHTVRTLDSDATRRWRVATGGSALAAHEVTWDTRAVATDLAELREHWTAALTWLRAAVAGPGLPVWTYTWRCEQAAWYSAPRGMAPVRPATRKGSRHTPRAGAPVAV